MLVIPLVSEKGGSSKSTLTISLAVVAQHAGHNTLILDTDPQATVSQWYESRTDESPMVITVRGNEVERALATIRSRNYDLVLIDTPGRSEPITAATIQHGDYCLIPCQPTLPDMRAQRNTVQALERLGKRGSFVLTRCQPRGQRAKEAEQGLQVFGLAIAPTRMVNRNAYPDAYSRGQGVSEYEPEGKAAQEITELWHWIEKHARRASCRSDKT